MNRWQISSSLRYGVKNLLHNGTNGSEIRLFAYDKLYSNERRRLHLPHPAGMKLRILHSFNPGTPMFHHSRSLHSSFSLLPYAGGLAATALCLGGWFSPVQASPYWVKKSSIQQRPIIYSVPVNSITDLSGRHSFTYQIPSYFPSGIRVISTPNVNPYPYGSSIIYGSPIPSPVRVNPVTGVSVYSYPSGYYRSGYPSGYGVYPHGYRRSNVNNSILVNPTIINGQIRNSTLINPRIIRVPRHW
jgi:hypothetical protein